MRLWSFAPEYLDARGLVALWREALLAQKVLADETTGYRNHPQLTRFRETSAPLDAIGVYLVDVWAEGVRRGFRFDRTKIRRIDKRPTIYVSKKQIAYERLWFLEKARRRSPDFFDFARKERFFRICRSFSLVEGGVATWERPDAALLKVLDAEFTFK